MTWLVLARVVVLAVLCGAAIALARSVVTAPD